ncbi:MAG: hypothetical protein Q4F72_08285, partial [Desulfovibrionaceae bacterium]|nr:hypothetical protein [Desulfovibrionaceae bacterium]
MQTDSFSLLAALSSTDSVRETDAEKKCGEIGACLGDELLPLVYASDYQEKSRMETALTRALDEARALCLHTELLGRSCVGIVLADAKALPVLEGLVAADASLGAHGTARAFLREACSAGRSVPVRLAPEDGRPAVTVAGLDGRETVLDAESGRTELLPGEYRLLTRLAGINPRDVVSSLSCRTRLARQRSTYLIVSPEEFSRDGHMAALAHCDVILVLGRTDHEQCLQALAEGLHIPVHFAVKGRPDRAVQAAVERVRRSGTDRVCGVLDLKDVPRFLDGWDRRSDRLTNHDRLLSELLSYREHTALAMRDNEALIATIRRDSVLSEQSSQHIDDLLESKRRQLARLGRELETQLQAFSAMQDKALRLAKELEAQLAALSPADDGGAAVPHTGSTRPVSVWRRIVLRLLMSGDRGGAERYQKKFAAAFPDQAFITGLYIVENSRRAGRGSGPSRDDIEKLRRMPDSPEVLRAKIFFRDALDLTMHDCAEIAALLRHHKDADEKYYMAEHLNERYQAKAVPFEEVVEAFRGAALAGSETAAQMLALYCSSEKRYDEVREIADMSVASADYVFHVVCRVRKNPQLAARYLKMAA